MFRELLGDEKKTCAKFSRSATLSSHFSLGYISIELSALKRRSLPMFGFLSKFSEFSFKDSGMMSLTFRFNSQLNLPVKFFPIAVD